jgi:aspartate/methionine/tyrosine aminotransferase
MGLVSDTTATLLATPGLDPMPATPHDLRGDQPVRALDPMVADAAARALESGQTHYVDVPGIAPLREAAARLLNEQGAVCRPANVLITAGAQEARFLTLQIIGDLAGPLVLPQVAHPGVRQALGARGLPFATVAVNPAAGMLVDLEELRAALEAGGRLIYLEAPVRLTGATYSAEAWAAISALAREYGAGVIVDQGLSPWAEGPSAAAALAGSGFERVALIGELAPGVGLQSWQVGYIAAAEGWVSPMQSQKQIMAICTSTPAQYAALEAMEGLAGAWEELRPALLARAAEARAAAAERGLAPLPGAAGSVLAISPPDVAATRAALETAGYSVADGAAFGAAGVLRLAVPADQELAAVFKALP